jgi:hypothetical protein
MHTDSAGENEARWAAENTSYNGKSYSQKVRGSISSGEIVGVAVQRNQREAR